MDKASDFESEDCEFESRRGHYFAIGNDITEKDDSGRIVTFFWNVRIWLKSNKIEQNITLRTRFRGYIYLISKAENSENLDSENLDKKQLHISLYYLTFRLL